MARHPDIARALGLVRPVLEAAGLEGRRVVIACSGGRDSLALLALADCLRHALRLELCVGHVDHGLRPESAAEAVLVQELAHGFGHPVRTVELQLERGPNLAERAREARRGALEALAAEWDAYAIALGHTATDQAETVLMNLTRGTGLLGLCGMRTHQPPYVRPLLALDRNDTRRLCEHFELGFVDDPSNEAADAARIRIRRGVIPLLEEQNPQAVAAIAGAATRLQAIEDEIERSTQRIYARLVTDDGLRLGPEVLEVSGAVLGRVVRRALAAQGVSEAAAASVAAIAACLLEHAQALVGKGPDGGAKPRVFDLRPSKRVAIDRAGLVVSPHTEDKARNH